MKVLNDILVNVFFAVLLCSFLCPEQHVEVSGYLVYCRVVSLFNDFVGKAIIIPNRT